MSAKKKSSKRSSNRRKASRRRKPQVKLNSNSVLTLAVVIIVLCIVFLAVSIMMGNTHSIFESVNAGTSAETVESATASGNQETEKKQSAVPEKDSGSSVSPSQSPEPSVKKQPEKKSEPHSNPAPEKKQESVVPVKPVPQDIPHAKYDIPAAKNGATLCFVIDDAGQNINNLKRYTSLPFPLTVALLPELENTKACSWVVRSSGKELILHQPMQSLNLNLYPGPGYISPDMNTNEIAELVKKNLDEVGPVKGMNNHEGSLITENEIKIGAVLEVCQERGIYFLDSRTTAATKAPQAALERDMAIYQRDVFIDDVVTREAMLEQIYRGLAIANKNGKVIMIGHVDKSVKILPDLLLDMYPYLVEKGYSFATPSTLN